MTRIARLAVVVFFCSTVTAFGQTGRSASPPAPTSPAASSADRAAIDRAIAAVLPSLVRVSVVYIDQLGGREVKGLLSGSGTIISPDGYVVTNHHVAGHPRRITCTLSNHEEIPADLVGSDPLSDIAVIKLHPATPRKFPAARFGDSKKLSRGQAVLAMGSPLALSQSVTLGIVSNTEMIMPGSTGGSDADLLDGEDVGTIVLWIGHDAAIYPGNSGGPLVNLAGEIVGVNEISYGLGGAIPSNLAKAVADSLIRDGQVHRSWLGLDIQPRLGTTPASGALVASIADRSPAAAAGLKPGDVMLKVNGVDINAKYGEELPHLNQMLFGLPIGQPSSFLVWRAGKELTLSATPVERSAAESTASELRSWGIVVSNLTDLEARELERQNTDGVRVISLRPNGPADQAKPALRPNDIIVELEGHAVTHVSDVETTTATAIGTKGRAKLLVGFDRDGERMMTVVDAGELAADEPPRDARKAWVPVDTQVMTPPLADRLGLKGKTGVRVTRLIDDSGPLKVGDVILAIDGDPVRATSQNDDDLFSTSIRRYRVGSSVTLTVHRGTQDISLPITLAQTPTQPREMKWYEDPVFEFRARDVAEADREDPRFKNVPGVLVESVSARGWASLGRLNGGDLILAIDGTPVSSVDQLEARMKDIQARKPASVVFEIQRGIHTQFVEIQPAWK